MTATWATVALGLPPLSALAAAILANPHRTAPHTLIVLNAVMPGAGLAAARRPLVEVVLSVLLAQISLLLIGGPGDLWMWPPIMAVGGVWALVHTSLSPLRPQPPVPADRQPDSTLTPPLPPITGTTPPGAMPAEASPAADEYCVAVRCTECGASVDVPVLQRMASCAYCGTEHLVIGHDDVLHLTIPSRLTDVASLRQAVLDHLRYRRYLELFRRHVAPLENAGVQLNGAGRTVPDPNAAAAAAAAEALVARRADAYRASLDSVLELQEPLSFLSPYRHGLGTLYQAAFGRDPRDAEKHLKFAIGNVEAATSATTAADLPPMGKLSYVKVLFPAAGLAPDLLSLPVDRDEEALLAAFGNLDQRRLVRDLEVIRQSSAFVREATAVVWRPWWIVTARGPDIAERLLVDGAAGAVAGPAPSLEACSFASLPVQAVEAGTGLRFLPMQCPTCGFEFTFDPDAVLSFCTNCMRLFEVRGGVKREVGYDRPRELPADSVEMVPFWRFPLRLRTADGGLVTDLAHLKDGIDGTLDQIGADAPVRRDELAVPAIRCLNPRLMTSAFERLFAATMSMAPPEPVTERFPLDLSIRPIQPQLSQDEARTLAPFYLAHAFTRRDLTRANQRQAANCVLEARLEASGRLMFLPVPKTVIAPFRNYLGRFHGRSLPPPSPR